MIVPECFFFFWKFILLLSNWLKEIVYTGFLWILESNDLIVHDVAGLVHIIRSFENDNLYFGSCSFGCMIRNHLLDDKSLIALIVNHIFQQWLHFNYLPDKFIINNFPSSFIQTESTSRRKRENLNDFRLCIVNNSMKFRFESNLQFNSFCFLYSKLHCNLCLKYLPKKKWRTRKNKNRIRFASRLECLCANTRYRLHRYGWQMKWIPFAFLYKKKK